MESGITKNQVIEVLTRSPHGKLEEYLPVGRIAAKQDPEFIAHLISWNEVNGQVRDSKVALPVATLCEPTFNGELGENSYAHMALRDPRELVQLWRFAKTVKPEGHIRRINRLIERYLRTRENDPKWFDYVCVAHRASMTDLYALTHVKPVSYAAKMLFEGIYPRNSLMEAIASLKKMEPVEAAGLIFKRKLPFLAAVGALGEKARDPTLVLALIERMSPTELVTWTKWLQRNGVKTNPALRAAYEAGLTRVATSTKSTFKTTRAAEQIEDKTLKAKLQGAQQKQMHALGGVDGNWLVLGDKSGSMTQAIDVSKLVAATLASMVKGKVHLVFFDTSPRHVDATGKDYDQIKAATRSIAAGGGTVIGCGLLYALEKKLDLDGIAVVSDGGDNQTPIFQKAYQQYAKQHDGVEPPIYFYRTRGDSDRFGPGLKALGIDFQEFDLTKGVDYYSLPNLVRTMQTRRYGLVDQIMEAPLLTQDEVFNRKKGEQHATAE